jgi:hypothetical protein
VGYEKAGLVVCKPYGGLGLYAIHKATQAKAYTPTFKMTLKQAKTAANNLIALGVDWTMPAEDIKGFMAPHIAEIRQAFLSVT